MVKITSWKLWVKIDVQLMELGNKRYVFPKNGFAGKVVLGKEKCERMWRVVKMVGGGGGQRWAPIDTDPRRPNPRAPTAPTTGGHPGHPPPRSGSTLLLPEFLFSGFFRFTFFLCLSILILVDLPLGHAWKKDKF